MRILLRKIILLALITLSYQQICNLSDVSYPFSIPNNSDLCNGSFQGKDVGPGQSGKIFDYLSSTEYFVNGENGKNFYDDFGIFDAVKKYRKYNNFLPYT